MKIFQADSNRLKMKAVLLLMIFAVAGNFAQVFAHGGEDHGDEKPKTTAGDKGIVLHTTRLGDFEVSLKHPMFLPDTPTSARIFTTDFETNEPVNKAHPVVEVEGPNGSIIQAAVEAGETAGVYNVKFPALPQGTYTIRAKLTYGGETDVATFSGVNVAPDAVGSAEGGEMHWARALLIAIIFLIVLALLGSLVYFVLRFSGDETIKKETVSA